MAEDEYNSVVNGADKTENEESGPASSVLSLRYSSSPFIATTALQIAMKVCTKFNHTCMSLMIVVQIINNLRTMRLHARGKTTLNGLPSSHPFT